MGFLTVIPFPLKSKLKPADMGRAMTFFPVTGALIGGILIILNVVLSHMFPMAVVDFILIVSLALITGGIHLDGLADTFDGLYGGKTREEALRIMKDSRVGAIGVVSLILVIGLKYTTLQSIPEGSKHIALVAMPLLSRWSMVLMAYLSRYARHTAGTGRDFVETVSLLNFSIATVFALVIGIAALGWKGGLIITFIGSITIIGVAYFKHRLGGVTGDVLGGLNEVNEVMVLLAILFMSQFK